jgi:hypothetical protein
VKGLITTNTVYDGLWLTRDWRYAGPDWFLASHDAWVEHLKIRAVKPGDTLEVTRPGAFLWATNVILHFSFSIADDWADEYALCPCSLHVDGFTERVAK